MINCKCFKQFQQNDDYNWWPCRKCIKQYGIKYSKLFKSALTNNKFIEIRHWHQAYSRYFKTWLWMYDKGGDGIYRLTIWSPINKPGHLYQYKFKKK